MKSPRREIIKDEPIGLYGQERGTVKFVDVHIHLSDEEYAGCIDEVLAEAKSSNVVALVANSMDLKTCVESLRLAEQHAGVVYAALGVHPWTVGSLKEDELNQTVELIRKQKKNKSLLALGEIGLDSKYMSVWNKQMTVFDSMLHLAEQLSLPVIIHSRGTTRQIVDMLPSYSLKKVLLHWFSNPFSALSKAVQNGYYITGGPPVLYSNSIREVVRNVPLTNFLTETDGPVRYFREPFNGKRTTPAFVPMVIEAVAQIKGIGAPEVCAQVWKNFKEFFGLELNSAE